MSVVSHLEMLHHGPQHTSRSSVQTSLRIFKCPVLMDLNKIKAEHNASYNDLDVQGLYNPSSPKELNGDTVDAQSSSVGGR